MEDTGVAIKVAGALSGTVFVAGLDATVSELRQEIGRLLGMADPTSIKMIASGRTLQEGARSLHDYGVSAQTRVLVTRGGAAAPAPGEAAARLERLERLRAAAAAMAGRDGRGTSQHWELAVESQDGSQVTVQESDRRALVTGLALHQAGRASLAAGRLQQALGELLAAEEALGMADARLLEGVDNFGLLLIDVVWCCYKLRDASRLGTCAERLRRARALLATAHGPNLERLRVLHGGIRPEAAIYLRLETLDALAAHYRGDSAEAARHLAVAQARWQELQVSDGALAALREMGYRRREATRALRFCGGDVAGAVAFLAEQRQQQQDRQRERERQDAWRRERGRYGRTPNTRRYVDGASLDRLCGMGYDRSLAAEALRQSENDESAALDVLLDPARNCALALALVGEQMRKRQADEQRAARQARRQEEAAADAAAAAATTEQAAGGDGAAGEAGSAGGQAGSAAGGGAAVGIGAAAAAAGASALGPHRRRRRQWQPPSNDSCSDDSSAPGSSSGEASPDADNEMEDEVAKAVRGQHADPLAAYDVNVEEEGEAITLLLSLMASDSGGGGGSIGS